MRIVFAGTPEVAVPTLRALADSPRHEVLAIVTRPDAPAGRGRALRASPVAETAAALGIEILRPVTPRDPAFLARLRELEPECIPVVAYGALIPPEALDIPRFGWINLHFSLLPAWRGAAPVQHAILAGDEITGATTFLIEKGLDTGPVFGVMTHTVPPHATSGDMLTRLADGGVGLMLATLDAIEDGRANPQPQAADGVSLAPRLTTADARVDWTEPALAIDRRIRACTPAPGAWTSCWVLGSVDMKSAWTVEPSARVKSRGAVTFGSNSSAHTAFRYRALTRSAMTLGSISSTIFGMRPLVFSSTQPLTRSTASAPWRSRS
jgi:methionyl-tRNA formyltransferase